MAKRNFYQRHSHGLSVTAEGDSTAAAATPGISTSAYTGKGNSKSLSLPSSRNNDGVTNLGAAAFEASSPTKISRHRHNDSSVEQYQAQQVSNTMSENRSKNKQQRVSSRNGDTARKKSSQSDSIVLTTRQKRWAALLTKRPDSNDDDGISAWLLEIMAVSDRKTPFKNTSTSSLTGSHTSVSSDTREPTSSVNSLSSLDADEILSSGDEGDTSSERHQQRPRDRRRSKKRAKKKKQRTLPLQPETSQRSSKKDGWEDEQDENKRKNKKSKSKRKTKDSSKSKREKRKRKSGDDEVNSIEGHELSGSYAEWRDRKKQKAMSKNKRHGGTSS